MKKRDSIYEAFLSAIDEDLRGMCEVNRKAELPLPCPYCGEKNVERLAKSLVGVLEERSPDIPGLGARAVSSRCTRGPRAFDCCDARFAFAVFFPAR